MSSVRIRLSTLRFYTLQGIVAAMRVLFVCLGNICRSPAAEGIFKHLIGKHAVSGVYADSAGIGSWHVGQLPDSRMRRHGAAHGYLFNSHARQVTTSDFLNFDLIVAMDEDNARALRRMAGNNTAKIVMMADYLRNHPGQHDIPDPYYGDDRDFELVIELLEDACENLLKDISTT